MALKRPLGESCPDLSARLNQNKERYHVTYAITPSLMPIRSVIIRGGEFKNLFSIKTAYHFVARVYM